MNDKITIEYEKTSVRNVYGGSAVEVDYLMRHEKYNRVNRYRITCRIDGIQSHDPHLSAQSAEFLGDEHDTNDETLTNEAAQELFEENM